MAAAAAITGHLTDVRTWKFFDDPAASQAFSGFPFRRNVAAEVEQALGGNRRS